MLDILAFAAIPIRRAARTDSVSYRIALALPEDIPAAAVEKKSPLGLFFLWGKGPSVAAGMLPAAVAFAVVVVGAGGFRVVGQFPRQKGLRRLVRLPGNPGIEADPRLCQSCPGPAADASADQVGDPLLPKESGQGPVAAAAGLRNLGGDNGPVLDAVELKGL